MNDRMYIIATVTSSGQMLSHSLLYTTPLGNYSGADFAMAKGFQASGQFRAATCFQLLLQERAALDCEASGTAITLPTGRELLDPPFLMAAWNTCTTSVSFIGLHSLDAALRNEGNLAVASSCLPNLLTLPPIPFYTLTRA